jgi:hypothetical protein
VEKKMENFNNNADYLRSVVRFIDDRPEFENDGKSIQELISDYSAYLKTLYEQQPATGEKKEYVVIDGYGRYGARKWSNVITVEDELFAYVLDDILEARRFALICEHFLFRPFKVVELNNKQA